jgi:hypothetical protein
MARARTFTGRAPRLPLSHSRISDLACPHRFNRLHIERFEEPKSAPLIVGGAVHDFAERYQNHLAAANLEPDITAGARIRDEVVGALPVEFYGSADETVELIDRFAAAHVASLGTFQAAELDLAFTIDWKLCDWMDPAVFFRAKIDRVDLAEDGAVEITDYSTSWKIGDQKKLQLEIYCMGVALRVAGAATPGQEIGEFRVYTDFIRHGYRQGPAVYGPGVIEITQKRLVQISDQVEAMRAAGKFPAQPGSLCAWCRVPDCPALTDEARDPAALAGRLLLLEREVDQIKEQLQQHVATGGPLAFGDGALGYWPTETKSIDRSAWIAAGGPESALKVDVTAARKSFKGRPDLAALVTVKKGTRWGFRKEGVVNED